MANSLHKLTKKFLRSTKAVGRYSDGGGLYLLVGKRRKPNYKGNNQSQRWEFEYRSPAPGKQRGKKRYMGLGLFRDVTAHKARNKAADARKLIAEGIDPIDHREQQEEERKRQRSATKTTSFKTVAEQYIKACSETGPKTWAAATRIGYERDLRLHLVPLHNIPINDIAATHIADVIQPIRERAENTAHTLLVRLRTILDWAIAKDLYEKANPAVLKKGGKLAELLQSNDIEPEHEPRQAIDWRKIPALMAQLTAFGPRTYYTVGEAARAVGMTRVTIYNAISTGKLKTTKPEYPIFVGSWQEHQIEPAVLFKWRDKVVDVIPGLPPISVYFLQFLVLNALRMDEVRFMRWDEWQQDEQLLVISWRRMKARNRYGQKPIPIDHVIPLAPRSVEILTMLDQQRERDRNPSEFVFGNYQTANKTSARIGEPVCPQTILNLLRRMVADTNDANATLHGMRTTFRSWGGDQRWPNGTPIFAEKDLERAIAHVGGYGETPIVRLYSRKTDFVAPLVPIFEAWEKFCLSAGQAKVVPFIAPRNNPVPFHKMRKGGR